MTSIPVQPISVGFDFSQTLQFVDAVSNNLFDLTTVSRVFGQVRSTSNNSGTLLTNLDSIAVPPTITVLSSNSINFVIPRAITSTMGNLSQVYIDFGYFSNFLWTWIPVAITWPVVNPVTIPS